MTKIFLILTVVFLAIGFAVDNRLIASYSKALAGTFFILAYIGKLDGFLSGEKADTTPSASHTHSHGGGSHSHH